jgi:protein-tyrosine phosphatase
VERSRAIQPDFALTEENALAIASICRRITIPWSCMRTTEELRIIQLAGVDNLRDVGGYATVDGRHTRWRTLYRSDCLDRLDPSGQTWLIEAGLRTIIDLRGPEELAERPYVFARSDRVTHRWMPFWEQPPPPVLVPDLRLGYRREVDLLGERMASLVETLATPGVAPALIHCAAGKDRTGIAIAIVLAAIGTQLDAIADDYALSQRCLGPDYPGQVQEFVMSRGYDWSIWEHTVYTPPERMLHTLAYLDDNYGGVQQYLIRHGLAPTALSQLKEVFTEPAPA